MLSHYLSANTTKKILQILQKFNIFINLIKFNKFRENNFKLSTIFTNIIRLCS